MAHTASSRWKHLANLIIIDEADATSTAVVAMALWIRDQNIRQIAGTMLDMGLADSV